MTTFASPTEETKYFQNMFEGLDATSRCSAQVIVPLILELLQPQSAIDIGCGVASWLAVLKELGGVQDNLGVDLDCIDRKLLQIPEEQFLPFDLRQPLKLDRQFDLVICLEVAGYLHSDLAETFINSMTELGPVILFSAPIPFQPDPAQINQQWPDYWLNLFKKQGYVVIDCFRKKIWNNPNVAWWFAQNLLLYVRQDYLEGNEQLQTQFENTYTSQLALVHPQMYLYSKALGVKKILSALPVAVTNAVKRKIANQAPPSYHWADYYK